MATGGETECGSDEYMEYQCSVCEQSKKVNNADKYCFDCLKYLCDSCLSTHNILIKAHKVLPLSDDTINKIVTERCEKHPNEVIQYFCRQHNALLCNTCQDHEKCLKPSNIKESYDVLSADPEIQAVPTQLKLALGNISKAIQALDKHVVCILKNGKCFLKDLDVYAEKLLLRIEELRERGKKEIIRKQEEILSVAKQYRQTFDLTKDEINQCLDKIAKSKTRKANMFILRKKGQTLAKKVEALQNESESLIKINYFCFMTNMNILDSLNGFSSLVNEIGKINVRIPEDKSNCSIYGLCHLFVGSLVIADYNNKRLKLVDRSSRTVTRYCDTEEKPTDVCCIGYKEFAVAFDSPQVHVYNAVSLTRTRTVDFGDEIFKIACHGNLLYAGRDGSIYVYDMRDGTEPRHISLWNIDAFPEISNIEGIAVNADGDRVYVTSWSYMGLASFQTDGYLKFIFNQQDLGLKGAWGVTTDCRGQVFVCGEGSYNVVKVNGDYNVVGIILAREDGILRPYCLSYDKKKMQLYVGGESDQLLVVK